MAVALLATFALASCATTGATFGSGVGDSYLARPPYRAGAAVASGTRVLRLPTSYQRGAAQPAIFDPAVTSGPVAALLADMNAYADSLGATITLASGSTGGVPGGTPPDVHFGCVAGASDECTTESGAGPALRNSDTEQPRMRLAVGRPSPEWIASMRGALEQSNADFALVTTLEIGQYRVTKTGWTNRKSMELGTGYSVQLPWLTSLDAPVNVLQITGAMMNREGKAVRIGAEGMLAKRTSMVMSGLGAQALLSDEDVEQLRTLRREDRPGRPLVWQVAIRQLVADLSGKPDIASR
jgi:hypothetical protein